eukprot:CAMPEP_0194063282 /NCGR_PEP_ID=MMETSP0009_2-20130614/79907_1 /TAXON_ID=210454 /ORGANISM="Grammatophora oceanica, Strain CCMP 410" /LENGTH=62 /DNA_ID=CAMNT_0038715341 /DNA_START=55 /DNA_END=240 /DNA_ORIENTATION=-
MEKSQSLFSSLLSSSLLRHAKRAFFALAVKPPLLFFVVVDVPAYKPSCANMAVLIRQRTVSN